MIVTLLSLISLLIGSQGAPLPAKAPVATVHGHVILAENEEGVAGVAVLLLSDSYAEDGYPETKRISSSLSDANGEFRLPVPAAGQYSVIIPANPKNVYVTSSGWQRIRVAKDDSINVDIFVSIGRLVTVRGELIDGLGYRYPHWDWVWLVSRSGVNEDQLTGGAAFGDRRTRFENSARYEIRDVLPGSYYLRSFRFDEISHRAETVIPVDVGENDVEMDVISDGSFELAGRIRFEGRRFPARSVRITARSVDGATPVMYPNATVRPDGIFDFIDLPAGRFRLSVLGVPAPFYVKSLRQAQFDVLSRGVTLPPPTAASLEMVIASDGGEVSGTVVDEVSHPAENVSVLLVPAMSGILRPDLYKAVTADSNGRFQIAGIAPGNYRLFAWPDLEPRAWFDPNFMKRFDGRGTPVQIKNNTSLQADLKLLQ